MHYSREREGGGGGKRKRAYARERVIERVIEREKGGREGEDPRHKQSLVG